MAPMWRNNRRVATATLVPLPVVTPMAHGIPVAASWFNRWAFRRACGRGRTDESPCEAVPVPSPDELAFDVVDVFADEAFAGNQLAVVHGTTGLTDAQLLALTREFGFSETAFPSDGDGERYRVRIYTPGGEIPFAGHPTLGTAWVLRSVGLLTGACATQVCGAGEIGVRFDGDLVELSAAARDLSGPLPTDVVTQLLAELGLSPDDRAGEAWVAGAGLNFVHLPV